jgi:hypothetical protein
MTEFYECVSPAPLGDRATIVKHGSKQDGRDGGVEKGWTCLREAASAKAGRQPFTGGIHAFDFHKWTPFLTSTDEPSLKDRIPKRWPEHASSRLSGIGGVKGTI